MWWMILGVGLAFGLGSFVAWAMVSAGADADAMEQYRAERAAFEDLFE